MYWTLAAPGIPIDVHGDLQVKLLGTSKNRDFCADSRMQHIPAQEWPLSSSELVIRHCRFLRWKVSELLSFRQFIVGQFCVIDGPRFDCPCNEGCDADD